MIATTGYWKIPCRQNYNHDKYLQRMKHSTLFKCDYMVFGDDSTIRHITNCRSKMDYQTHDRYMDFDILVRICEVEFQCPNIIERLSQTSLHRNTRYGTTHVPSVQLLLVWLSKILLVKQTIIQKPNYLIYGWLDAGYKGGCLVQHEFPINHQDLSLVNGMYIRTDRKAGHPQWWGQSPYQQQPIGGCWYGDKETINEFIQHCIDIIRDRLQKGLTLATEQDVYGLALSKMDRKKIHEAQPNSYSAFMIRDCS